MNRSKDAVMKSMFTHVLRRLRASCQGGARSRRAAFRRTLACERLENRRQLAQLHLDIQLWTVDPDDSNQKGTLISDTPADSHSYNLTQGQYFFVQLTAEDLPTENDANQVSAGVIAMALDVEWNIGDSNINYEGAIPAVFPATIEPLNPIVTSRFPIQRSVQVFHPAGRADVLQGAALPAVGQGQGLGAAIGSKDCVSADGKDGCREFSLFKFQAQTPGTSQFTARLNGAMSFADGDRLDLVNEAIAQLNVLATPPLESSLSGYVYADVDNDGVRDLGPDGVPLETGLPNVAVSLFVEGATVAMATVTTGPDGWYHFENLAAGSYRLVETQPPGFLSGRNTLGVILPGAQPSGSVGEDEFFNIELAVGQHGVDYNFGEVLSAASINKRMLLGSTPPMTLVVAERLGLASASVQGTDGDDAITVDINGASIQVRVNNDPARTFDVAAVKLVTIDAADGDDTVTINGAAAAELAHFQPHYVGFRRDDLPLADALGYGLVVLESEQLIVSAGANQGDLAVFQDSPAGDSATAGGATATVSWSNSGATAQALSFGKVRLVSRSGGTDTVSEQTHDFLLERLGDWL